MSETAPYGARAYWERGRIQLKVQRITRALGRSVFFYKLMLPKEFKEDTYHVIAEKKRGQSIIRGEHGTRLGSKSMAPVPTPSLRYRKP